MKFPSEFGTKVDLTKVNWDTMKPWIAKRITELLGGLEDEVLIAYVYEQLDNKKVGQPGTRAGNCSLRLAREGCWLTMQLPAQREIATCCWNGEE
jgi:hypothetical protein